MPQEPGGQVWRRVSGTRGEDLALHAALAEGGNRCVLLCPGPDAVVLRPPQVASEGGAAEPVPQGDVSEDDVAGSAPVTLILVDGRWAQAKAMVNQSPWLQTLPRAVLAPAEQSAYRFRRQPAEGCLSTLEAVAEALLALEGARGPLLKESLLAPFREMVRLQVGFLPDATQDTGNAPPEQRELPEFRAEDFFSADQEAAPPPASLCSRAPGDYCIVRWGQRRADGRDVIVVRCMHAPLDCVKRAAADLSAGQPHGRRCWVLTPGGVPAGARADLAQVRGG
ncbi:unnamed protein product [Prorocentrum cordatum]|uniref:tRNA-uridine aminocarboxypropyltransferase n=1 Tax=Prorocentrum cordatum TaxID=2364126 RepID=A0ABN9XLI5_9DINO|nr:unnamed protein product [Polarella glacialis]